MTNILDQIQTRQAGGPDDQFLPTTTEEFFALRLAAKLEDGAAVRHYASLTEQYPQGQLLSAYRAAMATHLDLGRRFHNALRSNAVNNNDHGGSKSLAALRIERRSIGFAIFAGDHLKYADARQLSGSPDKAMATATSFVINFTKKFHFTSAALETPDSGIPLQRTAIHDSVLGTLKGLGIGIAEVDPSELLAGFGSPPLRSRSEMRQVITGIYPVLDEAFGKPWTHDAAALGLYVQTERLFNSIN